MAPRTAGREADGAVSWVWPVRGPRPWIFSLLGNTPGAMLALWTMVTRAQTARRTSWTRECIAASRGEGAKLREILSRTQETIIASAELIYRTDRLFKDMIPLRAHLRQLRRSWDVDWVVVQFEIPEA